LPFVGLDPLLCNSRGFPSSHRTTGPADDRALSKPWANMTSVVQARLYTIHSQISALLSSEAQCPKTAFLQIAPGFHDFVQKPGALELTYRFVFEFGFH
jgi:hypothetical protein